MPSDNPEILMPKKPCPDQVTPRNFKIVLKHCQDEVFWLKITIAFKSKLYYFILKSIKRFTFHSSHLHTFI